MALLSSTALEFVGRTDREGGVAAFASAPVAPVGHRAGSHAFLTLDRGGTRPFSLASAPEDPQVLIGTRPDSGSRFKRALTGLSPGDRVRLRRPPQRSALSGTGDDLVLLAQGVGTTPHRALLRHLAATAAHPGDRDGFRAELDRVTTGLPRATYHVSGSPASVRDTTAALAGAGIPRRQVRKEALRGY